VARPTTRVHVASLAVAGAVVSSTIVQSLLGRRLTGLWIMPDEAIYGERALRLWQQGSLPLFHGEGAGYGVLYPVIAGLPLSFGTIAHGLAVVKVVQAGLMSLAAVPVYLYGRRLMRPQFAAVAAVLTLVSPLLLYSGLLMTEVLMYPIGALALLAIARTVAAPTLGRQVVALAIVAAATLTRAQAVVLIPVFAGAVLLDVLLGGARRRLRLFWPIWALLGVAAVVVLAAPGVFGAYAGTLHGSYPIRDSIGLVFDHLAYAVLSTGVAPTVALGVLVIELSRRRITDAGLRALVSVATVALVLVVLQVGLFAARFAPHLLGRDLAILPPVLFVVFAAWLDRGAPRSLDAVALVGGAALALLAFTPWHHLVAIDALPDTPGIVLLYHFGAKHSSLIVGAFALLVLVALVLLPRRFLFLVPAFLLAGLIVSTVYASNDMTSRVNADQTNLVGVPPNWVERAVTAPTAYLYDGERDWNVVWQVSFWNPNVRDIVALGSVRVPGPLLQRVVRVPDDGRLPISERYIVASDTHSFAGTKIAHLVQTGIDQSGLTLWKLSGAPRLTAVERGIGPNGDMSAPASVHAYDCAGGKLELTLLPKATTTVLLKLNGKVAQRAKIAGLPYWNGTVDVPPSPATHACTFQIIGQTLLGSTKIQFVPR
jgi:hypothetical protein